MNQNLKKTPTSLHYPERSVFIKEVNTQKLWSFELGTQEGISVPVWIYVVFQQENRQHDQIFNNDTFVRLPVVSAQCIMGTEKYRDNSFLLTYNDDDYSLGYGHIKESFGAPTKDNIFQTHINENENRSSNDCGNIGYNIHSFDMRYQKVFENAQPIKVEFNFSENIPDGIYGVVLVLTNNLVLISSDGQRMFDLT